MSNKQIDDIDLSRDNIINYLSRGIGGLAAVGLAGCADDADESEDTADTDDADTPEESEESDDTDDIDPDTSHWHRDHDWDGDADAATDWDNYETTLLREVDNLMAIDVDPDGRVWYVTRGAEFETMGDATCQVGWVDPESGDDEVALELDVMVGGTDHTPADHGDGTEPREMGGQGVAIGPDFEDNGYVYVYYHPSSDNMTIVDSPYHEDITRTLQHVSRFEMDGDILDPDSEEVILEIPLQINGCCHIGGYLDFDTNGNLYVTTGDDTNQDGLPDEDDPQIHHFTGDEREGHINNRPAAISDAQRTSQNTADLRGKVLRITPEDDGSYSIPEGNLKEWYEMEVDEEFDDDEFLPEIYIMGLRNPYVISSDEYSGYLFVSDYGNDAPQWDSNLGTVGQATYHLFCEPGNAGFPYFKGYYPNRYYDFGTRTPGQPFWFNNLRNRSPNNTGIENVPNVTPALVWTPQSYDSYEEVPAWADMPRPGEITWPEMPVGGSANAGPAYRYSDDFGDGALDPHFEAKQFVMAPYGNSWIGYFTYHGDGSIEINDFLPDHEFITPTDMEVLPDGRLVIMDYGGPWDGANGNISLIEYNG